MASNLNSSSAEQGTVETLGIRKVAWKQRLSELVTAKELADYMPLSSEDIRQIQASSEQFALRIPKILLERTKAKAPDDPVLRQYLPAKEELIDVAHYSNDPLEEESASPVPGLLHKYHGRVLVVVNGSCAVHCRYCFRRHYPYQEHRLGDRQWQDIIAYIKKDQSLHEVILSGGDPLTTSDNALQKRIQDVAAIPHVRRLRLHTRVPVVLPERVTSSLLEIFAKTSLRLVMVIHVNHPDEISDEMRTALARLRAVGVTLLNQSVLLKGVNDNTASLVRLSEQLYDNGVLPYYLHMLDPVQGAAHFSVDDEDAKLLMRELQTLLPGYLVPKFVREEPGEKSKSLI